MTNLGRIAILESAKQGLVMGIPNKNTELFKLLITHLCEIGVCEPFDIQKHSFDDKKWNQVALAVINAYKEQENENGS